MKSIIKKGLRVLLGSALIASLFFSNVTSASAIPFTQGAGYQQGAYDTDAQQPTDFNWSRHSRFNAVNSNLHTKWIVPVTTGFFRYAPVIDSDGTAYIATEQTGAYYSSKLIAINPDGSIKWEYPLKYQATSSPVIGNDGYVYITSQPILYAINTNTGIPKWSTDGVRLINTSLDDIVIGNEGTLYITSGQRLIAVDSVQASVKWNTLLSHKAGYPAVDKDGHIYVQSNSGKSVILTSLSSDGTIRWSKNYGSTSNNQTLHSSSPLLDDQGNVYIAGSDTKELYSISVINGSLNWKMNLVGYLYANPAYDENEKVLYIGNSTAKSYLFAINLDGTIKWQVPTIGSKTSPIIDNKGDIYINTLNVLSVYSKDGVLLTKYNSVPSANSSNNVAIGEDGTLYYTSFGTSAVYAISGDIKLPPTIEPEVNGLKGEYYNNEDLTDKKLDRVDSNIDFNWGLGSPDPSIDPETYSVRWTGTIKPQYSDLYTFFIDSDDGARLWINNELIIDRWELQDTVILQGQISLEAGKQYDFRMEYFNSPGYGRAQISWSGSDFLPKEIIPATAFYLKLK